MDTCVGGKRRYLKHGMPMFGGGGREGGGNGKGGVHWRFLPFTGVDVF